MIFIKCDQYGQVVQELNSESINQNSARVNKIAFAFPPIVATLQASFNYNVYLTFKRSDNVVIQDLLCTREKVTPYANDDTEVASYTLLLPASATAKDGQLQVSAKVIRISDSEEVITTSTINLSVTGNTTQSSSASVSISDEQYDALLDAINNTTHAVFTPSVDSNGNLSWTNNADLENPPTVNIKGVDGAQGVDGVGISSITESVSQEDAGTNIVTVTLTNGNRTELQIKNGSKGSTGVGIASITQLTPSSQDYDATKSDYTQIKITLEDNSSYYAYVPNGQNGQNGVGISRIQQVTPTTVPNTTEVQINLENGTYYKVNIPNGQVGASGSNGATFTPSVSSAGVISWTNDKGLANPQSVDIKGPKGDTGESGVVTPIASFFTMSVDENGNLYVTSQNGEASDMFEYDSQSGNLYYITED